MKYTILTIISFILIGFLSIIGYEISEKNQSYMANKVAYSVTDTKYTLPSNPSTAIPYAENCEEQTVDINDATNATNNHNITTPVLDFTRVAETTTPTVVHIKTQGSSGNNYNPILDFLGGDELNTPGSAPKISSGSGVILSSNGYIVTNRHVIEGAKQINVILHNRQSYKAKIVGSDKDTDIAILKINAQKLPSITYGNSDAVRVGQWVVAVGNPFNLASTVTTGIVSAKARNIGVSNGRSLAIESFLQTDAAVNPGNSGGALVNLKGELIGINTAIATPTGYYAGYAFALPVNIVKKVVEDILEFGQVRRGFLGVQIRDVDGNMAKRLNLPSAEGIYVESLSRNGAASKSGLKAGDVIVQVSSHRVNSAPELQEMISRYRPGDEVVVTIKRQGEKMDVPIVLDNAYQN